LARKAEESSIFSGKRIEVIPNSVETDVFYPRDRRDVRDKHGIPQDAFVILSGSDNGSDLRKGYKEYIESIMFCLNDETFKLKADRKEIAIVTFGTTSRCEIDKHITHLSVGHIDDDETLAEIYAAADIYVTATLEDNLPNTVLESMACGTTVVGFETGGIPDMVKNKYNGALVPVKDTKALAEAILFLFSNPEKTDEYGRNSRKTIEGNFTQTHQAERYLELFKDLKPIEQEMEPVDADEIFSCALQVSQLTRQMTNKINKELWEKQNIINKLNEDIVEKQNIIDLKNAEINSIIHSKKYRLAQFIAAPVIKLKRKP
jgi:glycosyltransferase involved in cell wall biosynthesis